MRSTFRILMYINKNKVMSDSTTAVLCRISIDGKNTVLSTGAYCKPDEFNAKQGEVKDGKANHTLLKFRERIEQAYEQILKETGIISAELLKNTIVGVNSVPTTLFQAGMEELKRLEKRSVEINSRSTYRQSILFQKCLREYILTFGKEDYPFSEITEQFGLSYKVFLLKNMGCSTDKMNKCLCWLRRLVYIAVDREIIRTNPLEEVAYEKKNSSKLRHISRNELKRTMETPMEDPKLELAHRMFIFSSFCGLAYVDVYRLYPHHIGRAADGRLYIREKRGKTNAEAFVPLHPVAERILMQYYQRHEARLSTTHPGYYVA